MFQLPDKPQEFGQLITNGFKLWKSSFWQLILLSFIAVMVGILPRFFIPELNTFDPRITLKFLDDNWYRLFIYFCIGVYFLTAIFYRIHMTVIAKKGTIFTALWVAIKRYPHSISGAIIGSASIAAASMLLFFPGLILSVFLMVYIPLIMIENRGPINAFKQSIQLVKNHWWHVFLVIALSAIFYFVAIYIIEIISLDLWRIEHPNGEIWASFHLVKIVFHSIYYPLFCAITIVLLHDLNLRKALEDNNEPKIELSPTN